MHRTLIAAAAALAMTAPLPAAATTPAAAYHGASAPALSFTYVALPDRRYVPLSVALATDGSLWLDAQARVKCSPSRICERQAFGRMAGGTISMYTFPSKAGYQSLAAGPHGTAWIVAGTSLYVFDTAGHLTNAYPVPSTTGELTAAVLGPDGRMWLSDFGGDVFAVTASGVVSTYACPNFCGSMTVGRDNLLWGTGLSSSYQQFFFSVTTAGVVTEYTGAAGAIIAGPGRHMEASTSLFQLDTVTKDLQLEPLANLQSLGLDQIVAYSASSNALWFVGTQNSEAQGVVGTISLKGAIHDEPFANAPCRETFVYFSALTQGTDGAMYGGYGCGDTNGTHAGYLARIAPR